jgi:hypothetical protein
VQVASVLAVLMLSSCIDTASHEKETFDGSMLMALSFSSRCAELLM